MAPPKVESSGLAVEKYKFGGGWTTPRNHTTPKIEFISGQTIPVTFGCFDYL
jgi:hypothetical protein